MDGILVAAFKKNVIKDNKGFIKEAIYSKENGIFVVVLKLKTTK
jgi:hypothetical protein